MSIRSDAGDTGPSRWLSLSGIPFVVVTLVAIFGIGGNTPDGNASAAKVASFYGGQSTRQGVAAFILAAAVPFVVFFAIRLALSVWPQEPGRRPFWQFVLIAGSVLTAGAFLVAAMVHLALADAAGHVTPSTLQGINALDADTFVVFNGALGVMMLGAAGSLIPRNKGYRILGWVALVAGIALFIPFADFFALIVTALWLIVASVMLFRREPAMA